MGRLVMGFWDCKYCGKKAIVGSSRECPGCGTARDKNTKFYMNLNNIQYVSEEEKIAATSHHEFEEKPNQEPNWVCEYCHTLNTSSAQHCASCGALRNENSSTYNNYNHMPLKGHEATFARILAQKTNHTNTSYANISHTEEQLKDSTDKVYSETPSSYSNNIHGEDNTTFEDLSSSIVPPTKRPRKKKTFKNVFRIGSYLGTFFSNLLGCIFNNIGKILVVLASILVIAGLVFLLTPRYYDVTIQDFSWERNIYIEKLKTVDESGWSLPSGARLHNTKEELYGYEQVLDHYETKTRTVTKSEYIGEEPYVVGYRDLGNGYFEEITSTRSIYETYQEEETYQEPVYRDEPIYKTKYYYEIDKWFHERTVTTSNSDKNPYWGDETLRDKERISSKQETYYITVLKQTNEKPEEAKYSISHEQWNMLKIGQEVKLKVVLGFAELVLEE